MAAFRELGKRVIILFRQPVLFVPISLICSTKWRAMFFVCAPRGRNGRSFFDDWSSVMS